MKMQPDCVTYDERLRELNKTIYLTITKGYQELWRTGYDPERLKVVEKWLDNHIDVFD